MDSRQDVIVLIIRKLLGSITTEEEIKLNKWIDQSPANKRICEKLCSVESLLDKKALYDSIDAKAAYYLFLKRIGYKRSIKHYFLQYTKYAAAAIILLTIAIGTFFLMKPDNPTDIYSDLNKTVNRESRAILISDNGEEFKLASVNGSEEIVIIDSLTVTNTDNRIDYSKITSDKTNVYNTLVIPPGGEYAITLADGSTVHLNSASKLKYPVSFQDDIREVTLEGEGYFTITKDSERPFIVYVEGMQIRQYGTVFNINTHSSDKIEIVLVEGSIGITPPNSGQSMVKPHQLAEYNKSRQSLQVKDVDIEPYISWHYGELIFENRSMKDIMNTLSLWYGIDIVIDNKDIETLHFTGKITRYDKIDYILRAMEKTVDIEFSIRNHKIHVNKSLN